MIISFIFAFFLIKFSFFRLFSVEDVKWGKRIFSRRFCFAYFATILITTNGLHLVIFRLIPDAALVFIFVFPVIRLVYNVLYRRWKWNKYFQKIILKWFSLVSYKRTSKKDFIKNIITKVRKSVQMAVDM